VPARLADGKERHGVETRMDVIGGIHPNHVSAKLRIPLLGEVQDVRNSTFFFLAMAAAGLVRVRHRVIT